MYNLHKIVLELYFLILRIIIENKELKNKLSFAFSYTPKGDFFIARKHIT